MNEVYKGSSNNDQKFCDLLDTGIATAPQKLKRINPSTMSGKVMKMDINHIGG